MIQGLLDALVNLSNPQTLLLIFVAVLFGMLMGVLPGLGGSVALALLIPISYGMQPETATTFLIAAYSVVGFGGMITSILVNTPGAPENAATTFDGYALARQGRAPEAIGAATASSVLGGLLGTFVLILLVPLARKLILAFSYPEFFMMAILGLSVIAVVTHGQTYKGLISAGVGFMLAFIGLDPVTGSPRYTFDQLYLWEGLGIVPVLVGLFAGAEVLALYGMGSAVARRIDPAERTTSTFLQGVGAGLRRWFLIVRGSIIGVVVGIIPGVGGTVASFLSYGHAAQTSRNPERFGKGAVEGVIAAESANDAKEGGSLLPTVAFGIPGSTGMAVVLGALILHGVPAGPTLMRDHVNIVYALIISMAVSKLIAPFVVWAIGSRATWFTQIRPQVLAPLIAVTALVGVYALQQQILDILVAVVFGYVGYQMSKHNFSRVALIIALVLGGLVEDSYHQTVSAFGGVSGFVTRPISAVLLALTIASLVAPALLARRRRNRSRRDGVEVGHS
ncbi:MAG: tricarboxylic transporter [Streptosporangiales bacterium]|nr:tricarboxylic transporter [Streptosporangiales bacterium]